MNKKILSLAVVLVMVLVLGACQSPAPSPAAEATKAPAAATAAPAADDTADAEEEAPVEPTSELDPYELTWYMYCAKSSDQATVIAEELNKTLTEKFNATVNIVMISGGDWNDKALPPLRAGEKIDIFWTPEWMGFANNLASNLLLPLNDPAGPAGDLIAQYGPQTLVDMGDFVAANLVDGKLYTVSTIKELCVPGGLIWNKKLVDKYDIDIAKVQDIASLNEVLATFEEAEEFKAGGFYPLAHAGSFTFIEPYIQGFLNNMSAIVIRIGEPNANTAVPEIAWYSDEYKEYTAAAKEWTDKKYTHPDNYLRSFLLDDHINAGQFLVATNFVLKGGQVKSKELMAASGNPDLEMIEVQTSASVNVTTHAGGSMWGIPITSKDPARAMMLLNELYQNTDFLNTVVWGVEGVHNNVVSPGVRQAVDMNGWTDSMGGAWTMGNQLKQDIGPNEDPEKYAQMAALTAEAWGHESLGYRFWDQPAHDGVYVAYKNWADTYERAFKTGVNLDQWDAAMAELKAIGIDDLLTVIQENYAAWKAAK